MRIIKSKYKIYSNKLNKIKSTNKRNYYNAQVTKCKNNLKATWKIKGTLIKRKSKGMQYPAKLIRNNCSYTNKRDIAKSAQSTIRYCRTQRRIQTGATGA